MKYFLLLLLCYSIASQSKAQTPLNNLPAGKYETKCRSGQTKWETGDITLMEDGRYMVSSSDEMGEYKFSAAAQRIFFTSGPLKAAYAITSLNVTTPVIILPLQENRALKLPAEVWGYYRQ